MENMLYMRMKVIFGAQGTVRKSWKKIMVELEISGRFETKQTTAFLRPARMFRRVIENCREITVTHALMKEQDHQITQM